ncbi:WD40-repeat-containing domain protein [Gigaspora rosea]|uniref:WD40-repeat-containing domain protein n=1 Tax=Gigaspora rosea TaxID=44941 RepID=A0A397V3I1_9GLOM|nr:WD40-repeat-containing domain protein [Gigaspora rosea]
MSVNDKYWLKHYFGESTKIAYYGVSFNPYDPREESIFATVGGQSVIIAQFDNSKPVALEVLQTYIDENTEENFYCCAWSFDPISGAPWLAVTGAQGIIKIIDSSVGNVVRSLIGHGDEINEIKFHPRKPSLLFSASKDFSIRLWNVVTCMPIAIFGGECGHREPVLSIDVHLSGDFLASSGMDHAVKIWSLCTPVVKNAIESSLKPIQPSRPQQTSSSRQQTCCRSHGKPPSPVFVHFPIYSTARLHNNYVDCVRWYGDLLLSRCAADATIILWKPNVELIATDNSNVTTIIVGGPSKQSSSYDIICEFEFDHCDIWFLRFGISPDYQQLATGNQIGQIYLWNLQDIPLFIDKYIEKKKAKNIVTNKKEKVTVKKKGGNGGNGKKSTANVNNHSANSNGGSASSSSSGNNTNDNLKSENVENKECKPSILGMEPCDSTIRQVAFSKNRNWMVAVCDDATIWCWKMNREVQQAGNSRYDPMIIDD